MSQTPDKVYVLEQHQLNQLIGLMRRLYDGQRMDYDERRRCAATLQAVIDGAAEVDYSQIKEGTAP